MSVKIHRSENLDSIIPIPKISTPVAVLVISLAAFISYSRSLNAEFVFDDQEAIVNNLDVVSSGTTIYDIFSHDFWGAAITHISSHKSYRPLTVLCFRFLYWLNGNVLNPFIFHCVNVILHVIVSCLTFVVYNIIFEMRCPKSAFLCALLFAVHPVHTETVVGVVGQAELWSAFFALLSFIIFYYGCVYCKRSLLSSVIYSLAACTLSVIAMMCKEQGITMIGVIMVYDIIVANRLTLARIQRLFSSFVKISLHKNLNYLPKIFHYCIFSRRYSSRASDLKSHSKFSSARQNVVIHVQLSSFTTIIIRNLVLFLATGVALYIRWLLMGSTLPVFQETDNPASFEKSFLYRVLNYNYIYLINVWILLYPEWLCFDWSMGCIPLIKPDSLKIDSRIGLVFAFWFIICCLIYGTYKSTGITYRTLVLGLSSMFILFSPASNMFFTVGFVVAERVLYLPSLGYFLILIVGLQKLASFEQYRKLLQLSIITLVIIFLLRSIHRTEDWMTDLQLFKSALSVCPLNAKVHYNLAKTSADKGLKEYAMKHYHEAIRLHPKYDLAMNNLANLYRDEGNFVEAEKLLNSALELRPQFATAWMNLGILYSTKGSFNDSENCYFEALKHRKHYPDCYYNLGNLYLELKRNEDALAAWKKAISMKPTHRIAWSNLIIMLESMGRFEEALNESYNALLHMPNEPTIFYNMGIVFGKMDKLEESEKYYLKAIQLKPSVYAYHYNLAILYHRWEKFCQAKIHYEEALKLKTSFKAKAQLNLLKNSGKLNACMSQK